MDTTATGKAAPWGSEWLYYGRHAGDGARLRTADGKPHRVFNHPLSRFGLGDLCHGLGFGTYNAAVTRLSFLGCSALTFYEEIVDGPGGRGGHFVIVFAPGLDLSPAAIRDGARRHLPLFARGWPDIDVSRAEARPAPKPAAVPRGPAAIDPAAFMAAVYDLAGRRPPDSVGPHHEEPAWNVDLFEVERRAHELMAAGGAADVADAVAIEAIVREELDRPAECNAYGVGGDPSARIGARIAALVKATAGDEAHWKRRAEIAESLLDSTWRRIVGYPFAQVCKHLVAGNLLGDLEDAGWGVSKDLARAVTGADDARALAEPSLPRPPLRPAATEAGMAAVAP